MITKHKDGGGDFHTTSDFWDCECEENYIHSSLLKECYVCGVMEENAPESRVREMETILEQAGDGGTTRCLS